MDTLTKQQQDILLDYYFECADQQESEVAKQLLETHKGAREFYDKLHHSLSALEHLDNETSSDCPDHLVDKTIQHLYANIETENIRLETLLQAESEKVVTKRPSFWRHFAESAAIAAGIFVVASIFIPVTNQMRAQATKTTCQANLSRISQGITQYANENENYLPAVATKAGSPWWKIGSTEKENQSNTRHIWLLVKQNYVQPDVFVCPGSGKDKQQLKLDNVQIANLSDFPNRRFISYSFKLICEPNKASLPKTRIPLMSDVNPIFEASLNSSNFSKAEFNPVKLNEELLRKNSSSHLGKGQNVMFSDGTVNFTSQRLTDQNDDIFTVKDLDTYRGTEAPLCDADVFLVP